MEFIPFEGYAEIEPARNKTVIKSEDKDLLEKGTVLSVGAGVSFLKAGDIVHFDSWGCSKLVDSAGKERYVIQVNQTVIKGKEIKNEK